MDEVDQTAISWTLGKMVIEASKAIQPRSHSLEVAWIDKMHLHHLHGLESKLNDYGIQAVWAYGFVAFIFAACLFAQLRRKFRLFGYSSSSSGYKRNRKPSISQGPPISPTSSSWCWPLPLRSSSESSSGYSSLEEGVDLTPVKPSRPTIGRLRVWTYRLSSMIRRKMPTLPFHNTESRSRTMRHVSMPLTSSYRNTTTTDAYSSSSQPPSPRANSFFVPAAATGGNATSASSISIQSSRPSSSASTSDTRATASKSTSPPRVKAVRPFRPRQTSTNGISNSGSAGDQGWNDPPVSMFGQMYSDGGTPSGSGSGLAPSGISGAGTGFDKAISRNSSRVNLSEIGLAQRSASRAGTHMDH